MRGLVPRLLSRFSSGFCMALRFGTAASADGGLSLAEAARGAPTKSAGRTRAVERRKAGAVDKPAGRVTTRGGAHKIRRLGPGLTPGYSSWARRVCGSWPVNRFQPFFPERAPGRVVIHAAQSLGTSRDGSRAC